MAITDEPVTLEAASAPASRRWVTVRYSAEDDTLDLSVHATEPFGGREATVHKSVDAPTDLRDLMIQVLSDAEEELNEDVTDAISAQRILARQRQEPFREAVTYAGDRAEPPDPQPDRPEDK